MNILMIRWKSICEPDIIAAWGSIPVTVTQWELSTKDPDYDQQVLRELSEQLLAHSYSFVFSVDYFPIVARVCNALHVRYVSWSVDCPVVQYYSKTLSYEYNRIFLFDYAMYEEFYPENPKHTYYLPLGGAVAHNDEVLASITEEDRKKYAADVSFIGSTYEEKCKYNTLSGLSSYTKGYADGLIETQLLVYGYNFLEEAMTEKFIAHFREDTGIGAVNEDYRENVRAFIAQLYLGEKVTEQERLRLLKRLGKRFYVDMYTMSDTSRLLGVTNRGSAESRVEMPKIFHLSKINLNMTSKTIRTGLPQRFFDVLAAGGFLLSNMQAELPEFLVPGQDVETYASFEECEAKIAYYLEHEEERKQIQENGYRKVKEHHTIRHRLCLMLEILAKD